MDDKPDLLGVGHVAKVQCEELSRLPRTIHKKEKNGFKKSRIGLKNCV